jgi:predicted PurR-regulated permease PerM
MEEPRTYLPNNNSERYDSDHVIKLLVGIVISTAVLYLARGLLLPVAMGAILAIIYSPVANRLDQFVGRFISAAMVVVGAVAMVAAVGYFLTIELTSVAMQISDYSTIIGAKLAAIERSTPGSNISKQVSGTFSGNLKIPNQNRNRKRRR